MEVPCWYSCSIGASVEPGQVREQVVVMWRSALMWNQGSIACACGACARRTWHCYCTCTKDVALLLHMHEGRGIIIAHARRTWHYHCTCTKGRGIIIAHARRTWHCYCTCMMKDVALLLQGRDIVIAWAWRMYTKKHLMVKKNIS